MKVAALVSLGATLFLTACEPPTRRAVLDIDGNRLVGDEGFYEVFAFDLSDPDYSPPVGTGGAFDFVLTVDGGPEGMEFPNIGGGPFHGSSGGYWEGRISNVEIVLNNIPLDARVNRLVELHDYLAGAGFVPAVLAETVSNIPDIDLTELFAAKDRAALDAAWASERVQTDLFARPANLSKLGVTAFLLERGDILAHCDVMGIGEPQDDPLRITSRTSCAFASAPEDD